MPKGRTCIVDKACLWIHPNCYAKIAWWPPSYWHFVVMQKYLSIPLKDARKSFGVVFPTMVWHFLPIKQSAAGRGCGCGCGWRWGGPIRPRPSPTPRTSGTAAPVGSRDAQCRCTIDQTPRPCSCGCRPTAPTPAVANGQREPLFQGLIAENIVLLDVRSSHRGISLGG